MSRSHLILGSLFIAVGTLFLLDQASVLSIGEVVAAWWPMLIVAAGSAQMLLRPRNAIAGVLLLLVGGGLLLWTHGVVSTLAPLWPILLIVLGIWLMAGRRIVSGSIAERWIDSEAEIVALFDDHRAVAPPGSYTGGSVVTIFGDVDLDLSPAQLVDGGASLQVTTIFGDLDLLIPRGWAVTVSGPRLFGGLKVDPALEPTVDDTRPILRLRVVTVFGDVAARAPAVATAAGCGPDRGISFGWPF